MSYPEMVEDLHHFIESHQIKSPTLIAHSMGGKVAMLYALTYPEKVQSLIIEDVAPVFYPTRFKDIAEAMDQIPMDQIQSHRDADNLLQHSIPSIPLRRFILTNLVRENGIFSWRCHVQAILNSMEDIAGFHGLEKNMVFNLPALFIYGSQSDYVQEKGQKEIKTLFPNAKLESIDSGHWVHAEQPDRFTELCLHFLKDL